jgi:hypothetical protein
MANWKKVIVSGSAAELASLSLGTALPVGSGGTGASTLTNGGVLLGSGTDSITALGQATNGQLVIGSTGADPVLATLTGGANITVTNTAGGISIAASGLGSGTVQSVSGSGNVNGITLTSNLNSVNPVLTLGGTLANIDNAALTNDDITIGSTAIALGASATTIAGLTSVTSTTFTGSLSGNATTATTATTANGVAANSVALGTDTTGNYVATLGTGTGVTIGSNTGEGSTPTIAVNYGSNANNAVEGNTTITLTQTAGEIDITGTAAQALGGAPSYTIGLADTISGNRTFSGDTITIANDLIVQGTASFQSTTNLEVADQFILLNSGSSTDNSPGGIVIQQNVQDEGVLFGYDAAAHANDGRWGVTSSFDASATTFTADAYVSYVIDIDASQSDIALYQKNGNIKVDGGDIFIYS